MSRPINPNLYVEGKPCRKCGGTKRYASTRQCVTCMRAARAKAMAKREELYDDNAPGTGTTRIGRMLELEARSGEAIERRAALDKLTRYKTSGAFARDQRKLHPAAPEAKPVCFGDIYRASLPVGGAHLDAPTPSRDFSGQDADALALNAAVAEIYASLPDIVQLTDVVAMIPESLRTALGNRIWVRLARLLTERGAIGRDIGIAQKRTARRVFLIRDQFQYLRITRSRLEAAYKGQQRAGQRLLMDAGAYQSMVNGPKSTQHPLEMSGRAPADRPRPNPPGRPNAHHGPSVGHRRGMVNRKVA